MVRRLASYFVRRLTGYDVVRIALAILLLTAAALKAYQLATEPVLGPGFFDSRWVLIVAVEFELLFGLWLLGNIWPKPTWAAALACFALFTCISVYKALSGETTCGCFGALRVNPWWTATADLVIVCSLLSWPPEHRASLHPYFASESSFRATTVFAAWFSLGVPAAIAMGSFADTTLSDAGEIIGDGKIVVLRPETWTGKRFPLLTYIDIGETLKEGNWLIVLYHGDCPRCRTMMRELPEIARECPGARVALIAVPPDSDWDEVGPKDCVQGRLSATKEWFVETPLVLNLVRGNVVSFIGSGGDPDVAARSSSRADVRG